MKVGLISVALLAPVLVCLSAFEIDLNETPDAPTNLKAMLAIEQEPVDNKPSSARYEFNGHLSNIGQSIQTIGSIAGERNRMAIRKRTQTGGATGSLKNNDNTRKLDELNAKVRSLLDSLRICDDQQFDINRIRIPEEFSQENKAMMVLSQVAGKNLIKAEYKTRYDRIMSNCAILSRAVNDKIASRMDEESQFSGGTIEDKKLRHKESPVQMLKRRFAKLSFGRNNSPT